MRAVRRLAARNVRRAFSSAPEEDYEHGGFSLQLTEEQASATFPFAAGQQLLWRLLSHMTLCTVVMLSPIRKRSSSSRATLPRTDDPGRRPLRSDHGVPDSNL